MDAVRKPQRILLFLDTIIDTRLCIINKVGKKWVDKVLRSKKYLDRESDIFSEIASNFPDAVYKKMWDERSISDLDNSSAKYPTFLNVCIHGQMNELLMRSVQDPTVGSAEFTINTWPYEMDEKGKELLIAMCETDFMSPAKVVFWPPEFVEPSYLKDEFDMMYIYDLDQWMNFHQKKLVVTPMPNVTVHAPLLRKLPKPNKRYNIMNDKDFFETEWGAHLNIKFLSAGTFSMFVMKDKENKEE